MAEYHIGCGVFAIYAGTLNKDKTLWKNKSECTDEAVSAVAQYLLQEGKVLKFTHKDKRYVLKVEELRGEE